MDKRMLEKLEEVACNVRNVLTDYKVTVTTVEKNNGIEKAGLCIEKKSQSAKPNFYLEEDQLSQLEAAELADFVIKQVKKIKEFLDLDCERFMTKPYILNNVIFQMIGKKQNAKRLFTLPHREFLDMAAIFRVIVEQEHDDNVLRSYVIKNENLKALGLTLKELEQAAETNTIEKYGVSCRDVFDVLAHDPSLEDENEGFCFKKEQEMWMYTLSNRKNQFGAALLLYPNILSDIAEKTNGDFYLLPSSIHEVILVPANIKLSPKELKEGVKNINQTEVLAEEVLTESVYLFSKEEKRLRLIL